MTEPLDFDRKRELDSDSWRRARPRKALIERRSWDTWLITLPGGDAHEVALSREHGAYLGTCDCDGFEYHDGPCAHLCTLRKADFIGETDVRGQPIRIFDRKAVDDARADHTVERARADGGRRWSR